MCVRVPWRNIANIYMEREGGRLSNMLTRVRRPSSTTVCHLQAQRNGTPWKDLEKGVGKGVRGYLPLTHRYPPLKNRWGKLWGCLLHIRFLFFFKFICLFLRDREREHTSEWWRGGERGRQRIGTVLCIDSPMRGSNSQTVRS